MLKKTKLCPWKTLRDSLDVVEEEVVVEAAAGVIAVTAEVVEVTALAEAVTAVAIAEIVTLLVKLLKPEQ